MSEDMRGPSNDDLTGGTDLAALLRLAGPREPAPADRAARVRAAVHAEWHGAVHARRRRARVGWSMAALATAAVAVLIVRLAGLNDFRASPEVAATIDSMEGVATVTSSGNVSGSNAAPGDALAPGSRVETSAVSRARLRLGDGAWLRVNRGTRLRLLSRTTLALERGAIYLDAGDLAHAGFEVQTPFGTVRDVGTEFEVQVDGAAATVRVREGRVRVLREGAAHDLGPSDELTIDSSGRADRRTLPTSPWTWAWAADTSARFSIEGRSLREFLDWLCRDNAWRLVWADGTVEQHAARTILHGSIEGLTAQDALAAVLPASGVDHRLDDGVLSVRRVREDTGAAR